MKAHVTDAAYVVLGPGSCPIATLLAGFQAVRALHDTAMRSPHLLAVNWQPTRIAKGHCVSCTANSCQIQEGSQS